MSPDQLFAIVNALALACWILLVVLPRHRWVHLTIASMIVPVGLALIYSLLIVWKFWSAPGGFSTLDEVALLFGNKWLLLAGWIHYLAFDLLVGSWEVRDSRERGIPPVLMAPILVLTFLFGPAGWLIYMVVRSAPIRSTARTVRA